MFKTLINTEFLLCMVWGRHLSFLCLNRWQIDRLHLLNTLSQIKTLPLLEPPPAPPEVFCIEYCGLTGSEWSTAYMLIAWLDFLIFTGGLTWFLFLATDLSGPACWDLLKPHGRVEIYHEILIEFYIFQEPHFKKIKRCINFIAYFI